MNCYIKDYPRPQFVRKEWQILNGEWNFVFDDEDKGESNKYFLDFPKRIKINVPYTYETKLSGIKDENDFIKKFEELTLAIQKMPMITGYCYTQLTDVQQEVNGLMDEDRKYKIDPSIIKNINAKISHH